MISLIIVLILLFAWLGYTTNWLRIRLLVGIYDSVIECEFKTWDELKPWNPSFKRYPMWVACPDNMAPLCGWDWLKNTLHIIPHYRIEIIAFGVTNRINLVAGENTKLLKDISRSTLGATRAQKLAYA